MVSQFANWLFAALLFSLPFAFVLPRLLKVGMALRPAETWVAFLLVYFLSGSLFASFLFLSFTSVLVVFTLVMFFYLGDVVGGGWSTGRSKYSVYELRFGGGVKSRLVFGMVCALFPVSAAALLVYHNGELPNIGNLFEVSRSLARARYQESLNVPLGSLILLSVSYGLVLVAGFDRRYRYLGLLCIASLAIYGFIANSKATPLYGLVLYAGALMSSASVRRDYIPVPFVKVFLVGLVGLILFGLMQKARYGLSGFSGFVAGFQSLVTWVYGHVPGFSVWLRGYDLQGVSVSMSSDLFRPVKELLGLEEAGKLPNQEPKVLAPGYVTNVNTAFSDIIASFGLVGSWIFMLFFGLLSGRARVSGASGSKLGVLVLAMVFSFVFWSLIIPIWSYNTILLGFFVAYFLLIGSSATKPRTRTRE